MDMTIAPGSAQTANAVRAPNPAADAAHPIDVYVGRQIRAYRKMRRLSQSGLADKIGLTFQQVQKYERAGNRVSASKLVEIARALKVSPLALLPPAEFADQPLPDGPVQALADAVGGFQLAERFLALSPALRRALLGVAEVLARNDYAQTEPTA